MALALSLSQLSADFIFNPISKNFEGSADHGSSSAIRDSNPFCDLRIFPIFSKNVVFFKKIVK